jgi:hypothetical protein
LSTPPTERPNSASNWVVRTWNSWIASIGVRAWAPARAPMTSSSLLTPSTLKVLLLSSWPLTNRASEAVDSVECRHRAVSAYVAQQI